MGPDKIKEMKMGAFLEVARDPTRSPA